MKDHISISFWLQIIKLISQNYFSITSKKIYRSHYFTITNKKFYRSQFIYQLQIKKKYLTVTNHKFYRLWLKFLGRILFIGHQMSNLLVTISNNLSHIIYWSQMNQFFGHSQLNNYSQTHSPTPSQLQPPHDHATTSIYTTNENHHKPPTTPKYENHHHHYSNNHNQHLTAIARSTTTYTNHL